MKRLSLLFLLFFVAGLGIAGDVAQFVNLGFSRDSSIFVFGQYGIRRNTSVPFASLYFVDVAKNDFLSQGVFTSNETEPVAVGQNGSGALWNLLYRGAPFVDRHSISHSRQGRLVYLYINGQEARSRITFRDFNTSAHFEINLIQDSRGSGENQSAAFHLSVQATDKDGRVWNFTVGLPNFYRPGVSRYRMKQVIMSPDEKSIVVVVEKITDLPNSKSIEYMVETVKVF